MKNEILNVLKEILAELKKINNANSDEKKEPTTEEKIEKFVDYIFNFESDSLSKSDLRTSNIVDNVSFKSFWDRNEAKIIMLMKEKYNILLSRRFKGCYLLKKPCNV